jgi:hypothetical protein
VNALMRDDDATLDSFISAHRFRSLRWSGDQNWLTRHARSIGAAPWRLANAFI